MMQRRLAFSATVLAAALSMFLGGCPSPYGGDTNAALGVPTPGNVRIVTTKIEATPERLHYKWSLIGSVNWRKATANGGDFTLSDTYPVNSTTERGGCNVYETDLTVETATGKWKVILHGSDGTTVKSDGNLPAGKSAKDSVMIRQDAPSTAMGLPANLTVATVAGTDIRLQVAR